MSMKRRARQLAFITVAVPVAGWVLERAARRAEARNRTSPTGRRLRTGAELLQRWGRGPLAARLGRPTTAITSNPDQPGTGQHAR
jgi:hypothetical protein